MKSLDYTGLPIPMTLFLLYLIVHATAAQLFQFLGMPCQSPLGAYLSIQIIFT